jgi:serine/threonine protein kinase
MELANGGNLEEFVCQRYAERDEPLAESATGEQQQQQQQQQQHAEGIRQRRRMTNDAKTTSTSFTDRHQRKINHQALSINEIWSFFLDICAGLEHLHSHGIIHRDLKPSSMFSSIY